MRDSYTNKGCKSLYATSRFNLRPDRFAAAPARNNEQTAFYDHRSRVLRHPRILSIEVKNFSLGTWICRENILTHSGVT